VINKFLKIPELASEHGAMIDNMLELVHWFMLLLGVGWALFFLLCLYKFHHSRSPKADYVGVRGHASTHIEIGVIIIEAVLLVGFAYPLWGHRSEKYPTGPEVVKVRAVAEQFAWTLHYPGPDGDFGMTDPFLISATNPLGINKDDPNAKDDFLSNELVLPNGRDVVIELSSKDVIHNLHLVPMRIAQDAIPGTVAHIWFKPIKTGNWQTVCGQLCGAGHSQMIGFMRVIESDEFDAWFKENTPKVAPVEGLTEGAPPTADDSQKSAAAF
jgi:cytochrome c oxidase subunit 2